MTRRICKNCRFYGDGECRWAMHMPPMLWDLLNDLSADSGVPIDYTKLQRKRYSVPETDTCGQWKRRRVFKAPGA